MPELPDITIYVEALEKRVLGQRLKRIRVIDPFVLRSVVLPPSQLENRTVTGVERLGKKVVVAFDGDTYLIMHLMIAGRLRWSEALQKGGEAAGRSTGLMQLKFDTGTLTLTEAGTKRRAAVHVVRGREGLREHDAGGIEPMEADWATLAEALRRENRTLKRALTDPVTVSGVGNAYSDEILHAGQLSPLALTRHLTDEEVGRLHGAMRDTLRLWIHRLRSQWKNRWPTKVTAFRPEMAVHGKFGQPCPVCGTAVQRIVRAENEINYCPGCQTGGRVLKDRSLSRLLRDDWPGEDPNASK